MFGNLVTWFKLFIMQTITVDFIHVDRHQMSYSQSELMKYFPIYFAQPAH